MRKYIYILIIAIATFSCQDVVELDLETGKERLVIEAMIYWEKGTLGNEQTIKLTKTSSYYNNHIINATGATVTVTNTSNTQSFNFIEIEDGIYSVSDFEPIIDAIYELQINYNGEVFKATETLFASPDIVEMFQSTEDGFNEDPEVTVAFNDFEDQDDFYRINFTHYRPDGDEIIDFEKYSYDARFEEDNLLSDFYESEELIIGDEIRVSISKISYSFFTFISVLEAQGDSGFGPFASPPVNVKGNCVNTTDEKNYPYGYFGLYQVSKQNYTFQ